MAGLPKKLIQNPGLESGKPADNDVLSDVLRSIRLSGSLQFCFMPSGAWQTDATPSLSNLANGASSVIPFHILVAGTCWLKLGQRKIVLGAGDVAAFPFATGHQIGAGSGGRLINPAGDLPPKPWRELPILRYGAGPSAVRLLCGYLQCDAMSFRPLRDALPEMLHVRSRGADDRRWLRAAIDQIVIEVDNPRSGGLSVLERLTEIIFIELLRHQIIATRPGSVGWLAALADPVLGRCLSVIHQDPTHAWSVQNLSTASGLSRSALAERFEMVLETSPMRYVRDWRLFLARVALSTTSRSIAAIAYESGYGTEAAFNRAFSRAYGVPPAAWRLDARSGLTAPAKRS